MSTEKMDPELKARWVAALRSGDFVQGQGALKYVLKDQTKYCCWGVLSEICDVPQREHYLSKIQIQFIYPNAYASTELPPYRWAESIGVSQGTVKLLAEMNDGTGVYDGEFQTFEQIADYIEKNL